MKSAVSFLQVSPWLQVDFQWNTKECDDFTTFQAECIFSLTLRAIDGCSQAPR